MHLLNFTSFEQKLTPLLAFHLFITSQCYSSIVEYDITDSPLTPPWHLLVWPTQMSFSLSKL